MPRNFEIDADVEHNLLRLRISGALTPEDVDALFEERARLTAQFDCAPLEYRALVDVREAPEQLEGMIERVDMLSADLVLDARRAAIVLGSGASPARLQFRDFGARYNLYLFDRMEDAERWIRL